MDYFVIGSCPNSMEQGGGKERKKVMNPNPSSYKMQVIYLNFKQLVFSLFLFLIQYKEQNTEKYVLKANPL